MLIRILGIFLIFSLFFGWSTSSAEELIKVDKALKQVFQNASSFDQELKMLTDEQISFIEKKADVVFANAHLRQVLIYKAIEQGKIIGFAFEDTVVGKWGPIRYLLGIDLDGKVLQVIILEYQEIRGKPIAKKRFLNQYRGKDINSDLRLRKNVDGVTGATISSRALTDGVRKLLNIFEIIKNDKLIKND